MNDVVTCAYCGMEYPEGTPASQCELLTEHIKICTKHPMRNLEEKYSRVRSALEGVVGVKTREDLLALESELLSYPSPVDYDIVMSIDAVRALLETI